MTIVKAIYKIPYLKHTFLIMSSLSASLDSSMPSEEYKKGLEDVQEILKRKNDLSLEKPQRWRISIVLENDFCELLEKSYPPIQEDNCRISHNSENLELLAVNILKNRNPDYPHETHKVLSCVDQEDYIEVFL